MFFKFIFRKKKDVLKKVTKLKLNDWMELTKEERLKLDFKDKDESMRKKKALLKSIREEYVKIKKKS